MFYTYIYIQTLCLKLTTIVQRYEHELGELTG